MKILLLTLFLLSFSIGTAEGQTMGFSKIQSPIIFEGNYKYAYRDPAVIYHNDQFYLYFTLVERAEDGGMYLYTAYSISKDLIHWSEAELLKVKGNDVVVSEMGRMIDPYLIEDANEPGKWWCYYKQNGVSMSYSYDLKNWTFAGSVNSGENVTVLFDEGEYILLHSPRNGIGIKKSKTPTDWSEDIALITLGQKEWPWAQERLTAATVIDLRHNDRFGKFIMFFHGSSKDGARPEYNAHNNASLGIAWSKDLEHWEWPTKKE